MPFRTEYVRSDPIRSHRATDCALLGTGIQSALECERLLCRLRGRSNAQEQRSHCNFSFALNNFNEHFMINARMCDATPPFFFHFYKTSRSNSEAARTSVIIAVTVVAVCLWAVSWRCRAYSMHSRWMNGMWFQMSVELATELRVFDIIQQPSHFN